MGLLNRYYAHSNSRKRKRDASEKKYRDLIEKNKERKILVVFHYYYRESWPEVREYLLNLRGYTWDLLVTYPDFRKDEINFEEIRQLNPGSRFFCFENRGYDIGPFIMALRQHGLDGYEAVIKLQSKGVGRKRIFIYRQVFFYRDWFLNLWEGVIGPDTVHLTIDRILNEPETGMIAAENLIVHDPPHKERMVRQKLLEMGIKDPGHYRFVAGTCFAAKTACLDWVMDTDLVSSLDDFTVVPSHRGLSLGHILERYFSIAAVQKGYSLGGNKVEGIRRTFKKPLEKALCGLSSERLYDLPYDYDSEFFFASLDNSILLYRIRTIRLRDLWYVIKIGGSGIALPLEESYPYRYLQGDRDAYREYCAFHEAHGFPVMSEKRFDDLYESIKKNGYDSRKIIITHDGNMILDGQHRACCLASLMGLDHEVQVMDVLRLKPRYLLKSLVPDALMKRYLASKYTMKSFPEEEKDRLSADGHGRTPE